MICVEDIGVWFGVFEMIIRILVFVNVFILVFIFEFFFKLVYKMVFFCDENVFWLGILEGYVNNSFVFIDLNIFYMWEKGI